MSAAGGRTAASAVRAAAGSFSEGARPPCQRRIGRGRAPQQAAAQPRSMRAKAEWLWMDSKFSTSTA
jgi:hypothetical protein